MSSSDVDITEFSYHWRDALLNVTILESLTHGIYTTFVGLTLWLLLTQDTRNNRTRGLCIWMLTILHLLATAHLAARWNFVRQAFIVHGATAESTYDYLSTSPKWMLTSSVAFSSNTLIADCILIWRCWIIWGTRWIIVAFPILCTVIGTIFAIFSIYQQATTPPPGSAWSEAQIDWGVPYFSMSLAVTVICTLLIIYRVITVRADTDSLGVTTAYRLVSYNAVIEIVVESAALYSISLCIWMAYYVKGVPEGNYPLVILTTATGLAPTLIIYRVCSGQTRNEDSWKEPPNSFIYFASMRTHGAKSLSRIDGESEASSPQQDKNESSAGWYTETQV